MTRWVSASETPRHHQTPTALWQHGFRPFFLDAGLVSAGTMGLWLLQLQGLVTLPITAGPLAWHAHEMTFGFAAAAIAGFLLTAVPNWTGRLPVCGPQLAALFGLWLAGRIALASTAILGAPLAAAIDLSFLVLLFVVTMREVTAGGNRRNLPIVLVIAALASANLLTHLEELGYATTAAHGQRLAIGLITLLITLIGGRIVPSFTINWLKRRDGASRLTLSHWLDRLAIALTALTALAWTLAPSGKVTGALALLAAVAHLGRVVGWRTRRTIAEPLVWVLHLGYGWLVVGFAMLGAASFITSLSPTVGLHALTAGAIGTMTLAVMTRASLGHTGRTLSADRPTTAIYALVTLAALVRVLGPLIAPASIAALTMSGIAWIAAFLLFSAHYAPMLTQHRRAAGNAT